MGEQDLLKRIRELRKGYVGRTVEKRLEEFRELGRKPANEIFKELCFCLLTANYSAQGGMRIQKSIGDGFLMVPEEGLESELRKLGHRFPKARAGYIVEARKHIDELPKLMKMSGKDAREWLVGNVKGLGCKEASHFLRNIGFTDVAIVDFHILDILERNGIIKKPKTLTGKRYTEIENVLMKLGGKLGMNLGELDLCLWYMETGKVLK
ncbi:MAG: N-glycosylase/DNA lyase [Candidatus Aenigmarchaeota archaeon]|nr:N-glycosylase/DNA lyase [Candidatus Aenigmarchaeota archaeon]